MDGLSVVANIAGLLTLASAITTFCYINGAALRDYAKDIEALKEESAQLSGVLTALKSITEDVEEDTDDNAIPAPPAPSALIPPSGMTLTPVKNKQIIRPEDLSACDRTLVELIAALDEVKPQTGKVWKNALRRIKWPMKKESLRTLLQRMERHKTGFTVVLSARGTNILQQEQKAAAIERKEAADERQIVRRIRHDAKLRESLNWLSSSDFTVRLLTFQKARVKETGLWLLQEPAFLYWLASTETKSLLWCSGIAGSGKSVLTAMVVEHLKQNYGDNSAIAYVYFDYNDHETQDVVNMLANLLKQILSQLREISDELITAMDDLRSQSRNFLDTSKVSEIIKLASNQLNRTYIIVDGLDECRESSVRAQFLVTIDKLKARNIRIFIACRPHITHVPGAEVLQIRARDTDIETYVLSKLEAKGGITPELQKQIVKKLLSTAKGTFLLTTFQLAYVCRQLTAARMKKALKELPADLYAAYESTLQRICANRPEVEEVVLNGLSLLMYATRALTVGELQEALAVEPWCPTRDPDNVLESETLLECFSGLVVLEGDAVHFVHYTLREFLSNRRELIPSPVYLAKVCITYALFEEFNGGPFPSSQAERYGDRLKQYPLLEYVAHNWSASASKLSGEEYDEIVPYMRQFLASPFKVDALLQVRYAIKRKDRWWIDGYPRNSSPLHVVARTGLLPLAEQLVRESPGVECLCRKDSNGRVPLHEAIEAGHFELLPLLLGETAEPVHAEDKEFPEPVRVEDNEGMTALHHAAVTGNQTAMRRLLKGGANISVVDRHLRTPLERALQDSGQQNAATALLDALIEVGGQDLYEAVGFHGYSALHIGSLLGYNDGIRQLLGLGFNPGFADKYGFTPLHIAAEYGHEEAINLLLTEVPDVQLPIGEDLRTPAHLAAFQGHDKIINLLLKADTAGCLPADQSGLTPLHWAALGGHLDTVRTLLPLTKDAFTNPIKNPIHLALWGGHREIAEYIRSNSPNVSRRPELDMDTVFSLNTLESLASGRNWCPSPDSSDVFDSSFLLREAGRSHLRRKQYELASVCFDLSILIYGDNRKRKDPLTVVHPEKYCNRCMTLPIVGTCYTCARCNFGAFTYDLCADCFEKRWQFAHIHDHYIPIPPAGDLRDRRSLLESLKAAVK